MIVTRLMGGLGNQMFQYAVGKRLATRLGVELKLDVSFFATADPEKYSFPIEYSLGIFELDDALLTEPKISWASPSEVRGKLREALSRMIRGNRIRLTRFAEKHFRFYPEVLELGDGSYLDGYWQSQRYFEDEETTIRQAFRFRAPLQVASAELAAEMRSGESVSLHVRRGDYVTNPDAANLLGALPRSYYQRAIGKLIASISEPRFFVFSDDLNWAREQLDIPAPVRFVDHNHGRADWEDMHLMSLCRHHVIPNSSFGWWGAWLGHNPDKTVIAPANWFADQSADASNLVPPEWVQL